MMKKVWIRILLAAIVMSLLVGSAMGAGASRPADGTLAVSQVFMNEPTQKEDNEKTESSPASGEDTCDHVWENNSDGNGQHCSVCGADYCEVNGHTQGSSATCSTGAICSVCQKEYGSKAEHTPSKPEHCNEAVVCTACGAVLQAPGQHDWMPATCQAPKTCRVCGATEGSTILHRWGTGVITEEPTEESIGSIRFVCETCGEVKTQALYAGENKGESSPLFWVILAALVVVAGLFAYVYFFIIRKKLGKPPLRKKKKKSASTRKIRD